MDAMVTLPLAPMVAVPHRRRSRWSDAAGRRGTCRQPPDRDQKTERGVVGAFEAAALVACPLQSLYRGRGRLSVAAIDGSVARS